MNKNKFVYLFLLVFIAGASSCGNMREGRFAHFYHNVTAHYNGYFNAKEKMKAVEANMFANQKDKYDRILPVFTTGDETSSKTYFTDLDIITQKSTRVIKKHDISKWVDDAYLLVAKSYYYKRDFFTALETFDYLNSAFPKTLPGQEARLWMVRCQLDLNKLNEAQAALSAINLDKKFPKELKTQLNLIEADYFIRAKQYKEAAAKLEEALKEVKGKNYKARYMFILAQLYQELDNQGKAAYYYKEVIKKNPVYDLAFQAKLGLSEVSTNSDEVRRYLDKLTKDDKNISYFDEIYYTLAKIEMKDGNTPGAIEDLNKSVRSSKENTNQKARSFLMLADIYFKQPDYPLAKSYYDSAANFINKDFPDYENFKNRQQVLGELVNNLMTIQREDSLQKLGALSRGDLDKKIDKVYQADKEKAQQISNNKNNINPDQNQNFPNNNVPNPFNQQSGENNANPFYNPVAVAQGYSDFLNRWGNRANEDNWRRSDKPVVITQKTEQNNQQDTTGKQVEKLDSSALAAVPSLKDVPVDKQKYYMGIPFTQSQKNLSNARIQEGLYNVGLLYYQKLNDLDKGAENFQELLKRFPENKYTLQANYYLYRIYMQKKQPEKADVYKNFILNNYPGTEYAMLIENPDELRQKYISKDKNPELEALYADAYNAFNSNDCEQLNNKVKESEQYSKNYLKAKFEYLRVICRGKTDSIPAFIDSLKSFIQKYPGDEITKQAMTLSDLLQQHEAERKKQEKLNKLKPIEDTTAVKTPMEDSTARMEEQIPKVAYSTDFNRPHHYIIVFPVAADAEKLKTAISNYNMTNYPGVSLDISNFLLNGDQQLLVVKNFPCKDQALNYYKVIGRIPDFFKDLKLDDHKEFIISDANFPLFVKNKDLKGYTAFFMKNYL